MPWVSYKTGISSLGYDEYADDYMCDEKDCKQVGEYNGFCERHFYEREECLCDHRRRQHSPDTGQCTQPCCGCSMFEAADDPSWEDSQLNPENWECL